MSVLDRITKYTILVVLALVISLLFVQLAVGSTSMSCNSFSLVSGGAIESKYLQYGGVNGILGKPCSTELYVSNSEYAEPSDISQDKYQMFEGGNIYWNHTEGSSFVIFNGRGDSGDILSDYSGPLGVYGFPISDQSTDSDSRVYFENGWAHIIDGYNNNRPNFDFYPNNRTQRTSMEESATTRVYPNLKLPFPSSSDDSVDIYYTGGGHGYGLNIGSGLDFAGSDGDYGNHFRVLAMAEGTVIDINKQNCSYDPHLGCTVAIRSERFGGIVIVYGHLKAGSIAHYDEQMNILGELKVGMYVAQGQPIAQAGNTGCIPNGSGGCELMGVHLHVELRDGTQLLHNGYGRTEWGYPLEWSLTEQLISQYKFVQIYTDTLQTYIDRYEGAVFLANQSNSLDMTPKGLDLGSRWANLPTYFEALCLDYRANHPNCIDNSVDPNRIVKFADEELLPCVNQLSDYCYEGNNPRAILTSGGAIRVKSNNIPSFYEAPPATSLPSECPADDRNGVYFYSVTNFGGHCTFSTQDIPDFGYTAVGNNQVKSVKIIGDWQVKLYASQNYSGSSQEVNSSKADLSYSSIFGDFSSAKVTDTTIDSNCPNDSSDGIYLYADKNLEGACWFTTSTIDDLKNTAVGDNEVSSIKIIGYYQAKLYEHPNLDGRSVEVNGNGYKEDNDLDIRSIGGSYSSVRVSTQEGADLISNLTIANGKNYLWGTCGTGDEIYIDRPGKIFTGFSSNSYDGRWCIHTANDDKYDDSPDLITFDLNDPATIYIYTDRRMTDPPAWLTASWSKNSKLVYENGSDMQYFEVYSCKSHPGRIVIPGQGSGTGAGSMYIVAFGFEEGGEQLCTGAQATPTPAPTSTPPFPPTPTPTPSPTPQLPQTQNRPIAFANNMDGDYEIYVMNADGTGLQQVTDNTFDDRSPSWSPDGEKIIFESQNETGDWDLYIIDIDGSNRTQLTFNETAQAPDISPNGTKIVYQAHIDHASSDIYLADIDGSNRIRLTTAVGNDWAPKFSPDGSTIAYNCASGSICLMDTTTFQLSSLTSTWGIVDWSPDGTQLAIHHRSDPNDSAGSSFDTFIVNVDGSGEYNISTPLADLSPSWSYDGSAIITQSGADLANATDIYFVNVDGSDIRNLTANLAGHSVHPEWAPVIDRFEPNNSSAIATDGLSTTLSLNANIAPAGDEDWYQITIPSTRNTENSYALTIETTGVINGDTLLYLFDAQLNEIGFDDDSGNGLYSFIQTDCVESGLPAGDYFLKVSEFASNSEIADYALSADAINCDNFVPTNIVISQIGQVESNDSRANTVLSLAILTILVVTLLYKFRKFQKR